MNASCYTIVNDAITAIPLKTVCAFIVFNSLIHRGKQYFYPRLYFDQILNITLHVYILFDLDFTDLQIRNSETDQGAGIAADQGQEVVTMGQMVDTDKMPMVMRTIR